MLRSCLHGGTDECGGHGEVRTKDKKTWWLESSALRPDYLLVPTYHDFISNW